MKTTGMTRTEFNIVKSIFKANEKDYEAISKIDAKIAELQAERDSRMEGVRMTEERVNLLVKKYHPGWKLTSANLLYIDRPVKIDEHGNPMYDEKGKIIHLKRYIPTYSEENGYFPTEEEYNRDILGIEPEKTNEVPEMPMPEAGNDFDNDSEDDSSEEQ